VTFETLQTGTVIRYSYLWRREAERGETEGRKRRPIAVGIRFPKNNGNDLLILFPITTQPPDPERFAVEIPVIEKGEQGSKATNGFGSSLMNTKPKKTIPNL
jgi:hypothetical protein